MFSRTIAEYVTPAGTSFKVLAFVCMTLSLKLGVCSGVSMGFLEFQRINHENHELIQSGQIRVEYDVYRRSGVVDRVLLAQEQKLQWRKREQGILTDPTLSKEQKEAQIKTAYQSHLCSLADEKKHQEARQHREEVVRFDQRILRYRTDSRMTNTLMPEKVLRHMTFQFEGQIIRYDRDHDYVIVEYTKSKSPGMLPSRLGTIHPSQLYGHAEEDVVTRTEALEGHEVLVYVFEREHGRMEIYIDPALGYRFRKVELFRKGRLAQSILATQYRLFNGVFLPTHHEAKHFSIDEPNSPIFQHTTTRITQATLNQPIDPNVFEIALGPATVFHDLKLSLRYQPFTAREGNDPIVLSLKDIKDIIDAGIERKAEQVMASEFIRGKLR